MKLINFQSDEPKQGCFLSLFLFNIILKVSASAAQQGNKMQTDKKEIRHKLSLFTDDIIVYVENLKEPTKKFLEVTSEYSQRNNINIQESIALL